MHNYKDEDGSCRQTDGQTDRQADIGELRSSSALYIPCVSTQRVEEKPPLPSASSSPPLIPEAVSWRKPTGPPKPSQVFVPLTKIIKPLEFGHSLAPG